MKEKNVLGKMYASEVKVDLSLVDDIKKLQATANNSSDKALSELKKGIAILDNSVTIWNTAIKDASNVVESISKAKIMANELGVELPANIDSLTKYYQTSIKEYEAYKNDISQFKGIIG